MNILAGKFLTVYEFLVVIPGHSHPENLVDRFSRMPGFLEGIWKNLWGIKRDLVFDPWNLSRPERTRREGFYKRENEDCKGKGSKIKDYKFNPVSNKIEPKTIYFDRLEDIVIACDIYKKVILCKWLPKR